MHRGHRKQWNRDERKSVASIETPSALLSKAILALGDHPELEPHADLERLVVHIRDGDDSMQNAAAETIAIALPTCPHKIPYIATLVALLYLPKNGDGLEEPDHLGSRILSLCWKHCRESMEDKSPRKFRAWIHFFACLCNMGIVAAKTLLEFLQNIAQALEELGASEGRLMKASVCIAEGLLRAGSILHAHDPLAVQRLVEAVVAAAPENKRKELADPFMLLHQPAKNELPASEFSKELASLLELVAASSFPPVEDIFPSPHKKISGFASFKVKSFLMESFLLPPEQLDLTVSDMDQTIAAGVEFPQFVMAFFDNEITPDFGTVEGYSIRTLIADLVKAYEINRREGAKTLLSLPRWLSGHVFRTQPGAELSQNGDSRRKAGWQLESTIIEVLISSLMSLPEPSIHPSYCCSLICELCKLSPPTFGPAVGKCIRKLHNLIDDGLDVEIIRRYGEWFATHMSNFGLQWVWKEWLPDLELPVGHPRKKFLRRILELEVRLTYFDRVVRSIPEPFHAAANGVMSESSPGPDYTYGDPNHPHSAIARDVLNWFQGRTDSVEVIAGVDSMKERLVDNGESEATAMSILRFIIVESLLEIGSRSFSHFLNAIERYIKVMRYISVDAEAKAEILEATGRFWKKNSQMLIITSDKLLQYQFVDPSDLVQWAFRRNRGYLDTLGWELARAALEKANGRVVASQRKILQLRKEQDDILAAQSAQVDSGMDYEGSVKQEPSKSESAALTAALEAPDVFTPEQRRTLAAALVNFLECLAPLKGIVAPESWAQRATWSDGDWQAYETWGWYRNFCRSYAPHLAHHGTELNPLFKQGTSTADPTVGKLMQTYWEALERMLKCNRCHH